MRLRLLAGLLALLPLAARAGEPERTTLRLVSFDLAGSGVPRLDARVKRLGEELARLRPDVVALQGVWRSQDGRALLAALADAGLTHGRHGEAGWAGSGLLLAARWPLTEVGVQPFSLAGKPHKPWHGDWWARKGVAVVSLATPAGPLQVATLHLHARHGTDEYLPVQVAQAREAIHLLGDHGVRPPGGGWEPARPGLLLVGDLECGPEDLPARLLAAATALRAPKEERRAAWLLARDGGAVLVRVTAVETVLDRPLELEDGGEPLRLSEREGRLARVELRPIPRGGALPTRPDPRPAFRQVGTEAAELLARARDDAHRWGSSARARAVVLLVFAAGLYALSRLIAKLKGRKTGCLVALLSMTCIHVATAYAYLGALYHRQEHAAYELARQRLDKAIQATSPTPPR